MYVLLAILVLAAGYYYFISEKRSIVNEKKDDLVLLAALKANQISTWRRERMDDAVELGRLYFNPVMLREIKDISKKRQRDRSFYEYTKSINWKPEYASMSLVDVSLNNIASVSQNGRYVPLNEYEEIQALEAIRNGEIKFSDLYKNEHDGSIGIDIDVPISEAIRAKKRTIGVVVLKIDPEKFLYPYIQGYCPESVKSCETILMEKEDGKEVFLNELKYQKNAALTFRISLDAPAAAVIAESSNNNNVVAGVDYRGIPVFAFSRTIPDTDWSLMAKMDAEEVYGPVRARGLAVGILVASILIGIGGLMGLILHQQISMFYRALYKAEAGHRLLSRKYDSIIKYANEIMLIYDKEQNIIEANDMALKTYQYTHEEMMQKTLKDLRASESVMYCEGDFNRVREKAALVTKRCIRERTGQHFQRK